MSKLKFIIIILCCLLINACMHSQQGYEIKGNIRGLEDGEIQLKKYSDNTVLDKTMSKNGKFTFKKEEKFIGDKVFLKRDSDSRKIIIFYLEPGKIKISGNVSKPEGIVARGTLSNDAYTKFIEAAAPILKREDSVRRKIGETTDRILRKKLIRYINDSLYGKYFYPLRKEFALKYNNTIFAAEVLSANIGQLNFNEFKALLSRLDMNIHENWCTNRLRERYDILEKIDFGKVVPDFALPNPKGKLISLSSFRGNYVLIDLGASWCGYCRQEEKNILKLYRKYHDLGFSVISISVDDNREKWIKAISEDQLPWDQVSSLKGFDCPIAKSLGVAAGITGVPYTLLLDREGKVIGLNLRGKRLDEELKEIFENK